MSESVPVSVAEDVDQAVAEIVAEITDRAQAGLSIDVEAYVARCPAAAERIRRLVPALWMMEALKSTPADVPTPDEAVSGTLGDYRLIREVGRGGMGIVYEAEQISLGRRVALKVLPFAATMDARQLQRFQNEARAAACLHHPNVVPVYAVGCERGVHYYAMQYVDGQSLDAVLAALRRCREPRAGSAGLADPEARKDQAGRATTADKETQREPHPGASKLTGLKQGREYFRRVAELGIQAAEALDYAHQVGVIHRDVKPGNLLLDAQGNLWVTDFGLAHVQGDARLTMTGDLVGTLRYMSPEQALGKPVVVDHRTDTYSLGATLYELLTLQPVLTGQDRQELLRQIAFEEPRRLRRLQQAAPAELEIIVAKALEKDPADRYGRTQELADDLRCFLEHRPIRARRPSLPQRASKWVGRHQRAVLLGLAVLFLALVTLTVSVVLIARSRAEVVEAWKRAEEQQRIAEEGARELRLSAYAGDVAAAQRAWQAGNVKQARELLARYRAQEFADLRGFEWHHLWNLVRADPPEPRTLHGHERPVFYVAYSPDGKHVATAGGDGTVRLWDAASGKELHRLKGHLWDVNCVLFTRDGTLLVTAGDDGSIRTWDVARGVQRSIVAWLTQPNPCWLLPLRHPLSLPLFVDVAHVALSPDEKTLAAACWDGTVRLIDFRNGTHLRVWHAHPPKAEAVAFTPDRTALVSGGRDGTVKVWDLATGQLSFQLREGGAEVKSVAAAHHLPLVAAASYDGSITLWNLNSRKELFRTSGHAMQRVAFSPDDSKLAFGELYGAISLLGVPEGTRVRSVHHYPNRAWCVAFSPDGNALATAHHDGTVRLWDVAARQGWSKCFHAENVALCSEKNTLLEWEGNRVRCRDARDPEPAKLVLQLPPEQRCYRVSADGSTLLTAHQDKSLRVWDLIRKEERGPVRLKDGAPYEAQLSPDGRLLCATSYEERVVRLWDAWTGEPLRPIDNPDLVPGVALFTPDSRSIVTYHVTRHDSTLRVRDLASRQVQVELPVLPGGLRTIALCPEGKLCALASTDHSISIYDLRSRKRLFDMPGHRLEIVTLAFSPDGKTLASGSWDGTVKLWHVATGRELLSLDGFQGRVDFVAFSPDGGRLLARGEGRNSHWEVLLWDGDPTGSTPPMTKR